MACNNDLRSSLDWVFKEVQLGFSGKMFISKTYILQHSSTLCSKAFIQEPMKSMVEPSKNNASVVEFYGSRQPPPLLSSSQDDKYSFSCASI